MTEIPCPHEDRVREALVRGLLPPELRDHASGCPACREAVAVSSWMRKSRTAALDEFAAGRRIPAASEIRARALARNRRVTGSEEIADILKPLRVYRWAALPIGLGAGLAVLILNAASAKNLFLSLPGIRTLVSGFGSSPAGLIPAALGLAGLIVLIAATGFRRAER